MVKGDLKVKVVKLVALVAMAVLPLILIISCVEPAETPNVPAPAPTPSPTRESTKLTYGPELEISGDWTINNETVVVKSEQPIHFVQDYHEQHKIIVKSGGCLKIIDSYIRSDHRFLLELYDNSKLIVENSKLIWQNNGAVIINLDRSIVKAKDSELDFVGIASWNRNRPPIYTSVELFNCSIRQLELDLFDLTNVVIEGLGTGLIKDRTIASERFEMTLKDCRVTGEIVSWIRNAEVTFKNCQLGQVSPDQGSNLIIENCTLREVAPRVSGYSGIISNLPSGFVPSFQLDLPVTQGPSIHIVDSTIENGWYFRYFENSDIEFRNCHLSVLRPMGKNYASVYDSIVREVWLWDTSGEIFFHNSPVGWIGNVIDSSGHENNILLSGNMTVENEDWRERFCHWGGTVIRREFFFLLTSGSANCVIKNEEGVIVDEFAVEASATERVLVFDQEKRQFHIYLNGTYKKTIELSSDASVLLP